MEEPLAVIGIVGIIQNPLHPQCLHLYRITFVRHVFGVFSEVLLIFEK